MANKSDIVVVDPPSNVPPAHVADELMSRDDILGVSDISYEIIPIPEWGNRRVRIRSTTAYERDEYDQSLYRTTVADDKTTTKADLDNIKSRLVVKCVVNQKGDRVFKDADASALGRKCAGPINRLFQRIQKLSGMGKESLKEIEGNSGGGANDNSRSPSPAI